MKNFKSLLAAVALLCATAFHASAQFDLFAGVRTLVMVTPQALNSGTSSNFVSDLHGMVGIAKMDIVTLTNGGCTAATVQFYTSTDRTNWTALANWANATSATKITTNADVLYSGNYFPGPVLATNTFMYPGTVTTPNAAYSGFTTSYILPAPFTNTGAITLTTGLQTIGFPIPDQARYINCTYVFTGTSTNTVSIVLTAKKQQD